MATAILLAEQNIAVDVVEIKPDVTALGSGITLQGNALRVLQQLGVWEEALAAGFPFDTLGLRAPDTAGTLLVELQDVRTGGPDIPATMGMYRPTLARILVERASAVGVKMRFGTTATSLDQDSHGVDVGFADGSTGRYDLVVGADGVRSWTRRALGIQLDTQSTGMGIWRAFTRRPDDVQRTDLFYGGPSYIAGYCPTSTNTLYAYIVESAQDRSRLRPAEQLAVMRELAAAYHGPWDAIRASLTDPATVNYTWFETHLLPRPWNRGRVVLIGDAVHVCPPTLAQGAALALEDAAVLAELLLQHGSISDPVWDELMDRRFERCATVVAGSLQLGQWMLDHDPAADVPGLMAGIAHLLCEPA